MTIDYSEYWKERDENGPIGNLPPEWNGVRNDW